MTPPGTAQAAGAALVTGGSRGLGRAAARALTAAGWAVAITGRDRGALDEAVRAGDAALALAGDTTDRFAVDDAVAQAAARLGPLDLVVASAGSFASGGRLWESDPDDWWHDVTVNLRGPQLLLHAVLPAMVRRGAGRVVLLGSGMGTRATPGASAYASSKAALLRLVDSVAAELAGTGVVLLAVSPGMVATDMTRGFPAGFLSVRPDLADPPASAWTAPDAFTGLLLRIADGRADTLHGRFVHVREDLDHAVEAAEERPEAGRLHLVPWEPVS